MVTAVSSDTSVIPSPTIKYSSPDSTGTLSFIPMAGASGSATISVTVNDGGLNNNVVVKSFVITVKAPTAPPQLQISALSPGSLTIMGSIGARYQLQCATNLATSLNWVSLASFTQSNAAQTISVGMTNPVIFYRLVQQ